MRIGIALVGAALLMGTPQLARIFPLRRRSCSPTSTRMSSCRACFPTARNSPMRRRNRRRVTSSRSTRAKASGGRGLRRFVEEHFDLPVAAAPPAVAPLPEPIRAHIDALWDRLTRDTPARRLCLAAAAAARPMSCPAAAFARSITGIRISRCWVSLESGRVDLVRRHGREFRLAHRRLRPRAQRHAHLLSQPLAAAVLLRDGRVAVAGRSGARLSRDTCRNCEARICVLDGRRRSSRRGSAPSPRRRAARRLDPQSLLGRPRRAARRILSRGCETARATPREPRADCIATSAPRPRAAGISARAGSPTPQTLATIDTTEIVPVDLNSLLYGLENAIRAGCERARRPRLRRANSRAAPHARRAAIDRYLWDAARGRLSRLSLDGEARRRRDLAPPRCIRCSLRLRARRRRRGRRRRRAKELLKAGGIVATPRRTPASNGTRRTAGRRCSGSPSTGLTRYGQGRLAETIACRWIGQCRAGLSRRPASCSRNTTSIATDRPGGGGEYPTAGRLRLDQRRDAQADGALSRRRRSCEPRSMLRRLTRRPERRVLRRRPSSDANKRHVTGTSAD